MTSELIARQKIDELLKKAGWIIQDRKKHSLGVLGVAISTQDKVVFEFGGGVELCFS